MNLKFVFVSVILVFGCMSCIIAEDTDAPDIVQVTQPEEQLGLSSGYKNILITNGTIGPVFIDVLPIVCGNTSNPSLINDRKVESGESFKASVTYTGTDTRWGCYCINDINIIVDGLKAGPMVRMKVGNSTGYDGINSHNTINITIKEHGDISYTFSNERNKW